MPAELKLIREVSPKALEVAKKELRETPEVVDAAVAELAKLVAAEKDIVFSTARDDLIPYLRPTKYYPESALALMKRVAEFRKKHQKILKDLLPEQVEKLMLSGNSPVNVLAKPDQEGRRVLIQHVGGSWKPKLSPTDEIMQIFYLIHQAAMLEPDTQICGVVIVMDFKDLGLSQIANLTLPFARMLLDFIQHAIPLRVKGVHIVNEPGLFKVVWKIFDPLIEDKLRKRLFFHGKDRASLHKHISPETLPSNYGGTLPELDYSSIEWYPLLKELTPYFQEKNKYGPAQY